MTTSVLVEEQKQAQAALTAHARRDKPQVMQGHNDDSSDDDDSPPQNLGNVFTNPMNNRQQQQAKQLKVRISLRPNNFVTVSPQSAQQKSENDEGVKLPSVFGNETDMGPYGQQAKTQPRKAEGRKQLNLLIAVSQLRNKVSSYVFRFKGKNPFNQRRQTASEDDLADVPNFGGQQGKPLPISKGVERKNTSGTLNRNESKTQLTTDFDGHDSREVELRAQSGENSQLFMESQFTQSGIPVVNRFNNQEAFSASGYEYEESAQQVRRQQKITVNLEDAVLEEQKLYQILEVSANRF